MQVELPEQSVQVINTHLIAASQYGQYDEERNGQLALINSLIGIQDDPVILTGDLNTESLDLLDHVDIPYSFPPTAGVKGNDYLDKRNGLNEEKSLDYVLLECNSPFEILRRKIYADRFLSDHCPVIAMIGL